ncbi:hypothetical protein M4D81_33190 [Paenibacillus sp. p3-SID867]|uniref:hypothetical protein n=1 Tax=Paenibacillus sp. p3-SID867 TaxID=2916363 RepID=UPI0021A8B5E0|nr:hypothetical protein [Paenibacillus sp. p3-SID867]MCT1403864.1 hypothetical protein [Paenibacillus sp. p3-SID867]
MKKTTIIIACLVVLLVGIPTAYATPLQVKESDSKRSQVNFKPLYPKVPKEWEVVNKKLDGTYVITYLSDKDSVLSISESNFTGEEVNKSDTTEVISEGKINYYYSPYRNRSGGNLTWVKNDILFEMNSAYFDRDLMMKYAKTIM